MSSPIRCVVLGSGGHARVVVDALQAAGVTIAAVVTPDTSLWQSFFLGVAVAGGDEQLPRLAGEGITHFALGLAGAGDNKPRRDVFEMASANGLMPLQVVHPSASLSRHASIGAGSQLLAGAIVNAVARIGDNVVVNTRSVVEHDCVVGSHVHISTGAVVCGGVAIGDLAHIGAGATIRQGVRIGAAAVIGAGAAVVDDVPDGWVVAGVPARRLTA